MADTMDIPLSPKLQEQFRVAHGLVKRIVKAEAENQLAKFYKATSDSGGVVGSPYDWQVEFHNAGARNDHRAIIAGNRVGKTRTAAAEVAIHLTGRYPDWWEGHRFDGPVEWMVAGDTNQDVRDVQQLSLFGRINGETRKPDGRGWVPKQDIGSCNFRQCGVSDVLDVVDVRHVSGGLSNVIFKSYAQGASKFQGVAKHGAWLDEEPEHEQEDIWSEVQTRLLDRKGQLLFTRTPIYGMTEIVTHFLEGGPGIFYINVGWDRAPHLDEEAKKTQLERYLPHQRDTRTGGVPSMGTSAVYPIKAEKVLVEPFEIPVHYRRISGCDFGIDHPAAGAWLAHDADTDTIYLYDAYKEPGQTAAYHAQAFKARGEWIPVAWPHDGMQRDKGSGLPLANQYRDRGANMLAEHATWPSDKDAMAISREAGNGEILERMNTGRFKVFNTPACQLFLAEIALLHRKDGQIVASKDDIESAVRCAIMMLRYAVSDTEHSTVRPAFAVDSDFDPLEEFSIGGAY